MLQRRLNLPQTKLYNGDRERRERNFLFDGNSIGRLSFGKHQRKRGEL